MSLADIELEWAEGTLVAHFTGEIDMSNAADLRASVIGATPNDAPGVVLDLSRVDYMDSAGIYIIHGIRSSLNARGQSLVLVIPPRSPVYDALRLAGGQRPGQVVDGVEEALRALESGSAPGF